VLLAFLLVFNPIAAPLAFAEGETQPVQESVPAPPQDQPTGQENPQNSSEITPVVSSDPVVANPTSELPSEPQAEPLVAAADELPLAAEGTIPETPPQITGEPVAEENQPTIGIAQNESELPLDPVPLANTGVGTTGGGGDGTIISGDASSQSETTTISGVNVDLLPGELTIPEGNCSLPEGETTCPDGINIENDNDVNVTTESTSSATTGGNESSGNSGSASIDAGDATAGATLENDVNINIVELTSEDETLGEIPGIGEDLTEGSALLVVDNENDGSINNKLDVSAESGDNAADENLENAIVETGNSLAYANILNILNANVVGSDFEIYFLNLLEGQNGDVNLNEIWKAILEKNGNGLNITGDGTTSIQIRNDNYGELINDIDVSAESGENSASGNGGDVGIKTGDSTALANALNFVDVNVVGAKFFFGVINIFGSFDGNLIIPRPEQFLSSFGMDAAGISGDFGQQGFLIFNNDNQADIDNSLSADANSGNNSSDNNPGDTATTTGKALAAANSTTLANASISRNNWFFLSINSLGSWWGQLFGWSAPDAAESPQDSGTNTFQLGLDEGGSNDQNNGQGQGDELNAQVLQSSEGSDSVVVDNSNKAKVKNKIDVSADSGNNEANNNGGDVTVKTGKATALANLFNFVNFNILGGRWFFGLVNVLGDWNGNAVFAYPDVTVGIHNGTGEARVGETTHYTLSYENKGYDDAENVTVTLSLPEGVNYLGDSSGQVANHNANTYWWNVGNLKMGEKGSFEININIANEFSFKEASLLDKLIPQVYAAEVVSEKKVSAIASIATIDPESNVNNNSAVVVTRVYLEDNPLPDSQGGKEDNKPEEQTDGIDHRLPNLEVTGWNNVNEFVYPGDTITFEVTVRNKSDAPSYDTMLTQKLHNGVPGDFSTTEIYIGTIKPYKGVRVSFGIRIPDDGSIQPGNYHATVWANGYSSDDTLVISNESTTDFSVRLKAVAAVFEVRAVENQETILGEASSCPTPNKDILPYVLLLMLSTTWLTNLGIGKLGKEKRLIKP